MANLLFIHGFATGPRVWGRQLNEFSKRHKIYTDIAQVNEMDQIVVVGWSMGAITAFQLFKNIGQKIKGLILVSAFAKFLKSADYPFGLPPSHLKNLERKMRADFKDGLRYFYSLVFNGKGIYALTSEHSTLDQAELLSDLKKLSLTDERKMLPEINVPTFILQGEKDQVVFKESAKYLHEKIAGSELVIFPGVGHAPFLEVPKEFNAAVHAFMGKNGWT
jgi:pimeloyl-[acyl-carrier protein] methyl ester esterase